MGFRWLEGVRLWSAAAVAGIQHQQHRSKQVKITETAHQQQDDDVFLQPEQTQDPENDLERKIDLMCKESLKEFVLGAGIAVAVSVNGKMKYRKAFGVKDFENFVPAEKVEDFKIMIYSVSKVFTAHLWMKFMEDNNLNWKSHRLHSVLQELPKFGHLQIANTRLAVMDYYKTPSDYGVTGSGRKRRIGAKELLTHTAGVLRQVFDQPDFHPYCSANEWFNSYKTSSHILQDQPGVAHFYSNISYDLVAVMLERLQRNSFKNYCMEEMTNLNMTNTTIGENQDVLMNDNFPGFASWPGDPCPEMRCAPGYNLELRAGSAAMVSNVDDLDRFGNITARMYQRAYLNGETNQTALQKLPLSKKKVRMQNGAFWPLYMADGEYKGQNVGWLSYREMQSNAANRRRLKMRLAHVGDGMGSTAVVSVSFHQVDVQRAGESCDDALAEQLVPAGFEKGTIDACQRRQPSPSNCVTPWELPPEAWRFYDGDWSEHAARRLRAEKRSVNGHMMAYFSNAQLLLYLMHAPRDRDSNFYHRRLAQLMDAREEWWDGVQERMERLERQIFRRLIREHERSSRKELGSLPEECFEGLLEVARSYRDEFRIPLSEQLDQEHSGVFSLIDMEMEELFKQKRGVPGHIWGDRLDLKNDAETIQMAGSYDVNQPFNVTPTVWATIRDSINNKQPSGAVAEGDRFAEVELRGPSDPFWRGLSLKYVAHSRDVGGDDPEDMEDVEEEEDRQNQTIYHDAREDGDGGRQDETLYYDAQDCEEEEEDEDDSEVEEEAPSNSRPDWTMANGQRVYAHVDLSRYEDRPSVYERVDVSDAENRAVPESWHADPCRSRRSSKIRRRDRAEEEPRSVVVSIACNQRLFDVDQLAHRLDDAFAQHFFAPDEDQGAGEQPDDDDDYTNRRRKRSRVQSC